MSIQSLSLFFTIFVTSLCSWAQRENCSWQEFTESQARVAFVQDGDTLALWDSKGVRRNARLVGIDTPETYFLGKSQGSWAKEASDRLKELLPRGTRVSIAFDIERCDTGGRLLVHVFSGGVHLNRLMMEEGWAVNYCVAPNEMFCKEFGDIATQNLVEGVGFLGDPSVRLPYLFRSEERETEFHYFVGNRLTKDVYKSSNMDKVPIGERILFYSRRHIRRPYKMAN